MPEHYRYSLPVKAGDQRQLGELTGAACATLVAEIAERHPGPVVLVAPDMQNALRLHDEIRQFTDSLVFSLADWETLPYDSFSPHQEIISSRLSTLYQLPTMQRGVLIVPVNTLMQRVCPHSYLHGHALVMKKGQRLSRDALREQLDGAGYRHVDQVMEHGEYATRGALLDLYPMGSDQPYRLDFFDDEIDSLRVFDADTQRTLEEVESINLLPAHEFPTDKTAIELFRSQWRDKFDVKRDAEHIYQQVSKGTLPAGIEYWQKLSEGSLLSLDNQIDTTTGTIKLKARFNNQDDALFPNQFVNARMLVATEENAVVIPTAALQMGNEGNFVWVLNSENKVSKHLVKTGIQDSQTVVISAGLSAGDRVVTDGIDRLTEGAKVEVVEPAKQGAAS